MSSKTMEVMVAGRKLALSNLEKNLYAPAEFTKAEVIQYYSRVAEVLLPHLKGRALTLKRYPNGAQAPFFYEKNCPSHRPPWVRTVKPKKPGDDAPEFCTVDDVAALVWVANLASLELHVSLAKARTPNVADVLAFDLDPGPPAGILDACRIALRLRKLLERQGLESVVKVSGGKGMHVYVPLNMRATFEQTKPFSREVALALAADDPAGVTATMAKAQRTNKVFIDWSQNDRHKTTCCVYSLRARQRPSVSAPVTWKEVEAAVRRKDAGLLHFEPAALLARVEKHGDLFAGALTLKQSLPERLKAPA